jgi:hypothetical protein
VANYQAARDAGLTGGNINRWAASANGDFAVRSIQKWRDRADGQYLGPTNMPHAVRGLLERDGLLPSMNAYVRRQGGSQEMSPDVYVQATVDYLEKCRREGRAPTPGDTVTVPVNVVERPSRFTRWQHAAEESVTVDIGTRLTQPPGPGQIDDRELRAWADAGWQPSTLYTDPRLSKLAERYDWLVEHEPVAPNRRAPQTYVPSPHVPETFGLRGLPPAYADLVASQPNFYPPSVASQPNPAADPVTSRPASPRPASAPPGGTSTPTTAEIAAARYRVQPDAPLGVNSAGLPVNRRPVAAQSSGPVRGR